MDGFCIWFTGLSASGKSTLTHLLEHELKNLGHLVEVLDGDVIRTNLSKGLGFSREDRETNLRRIGFVANLLARNGVSVIVATISPYQGIREEIRKMIGNFVEVFLDCPLDVCIQRDPKGLYKKALAGELKQFTGIDDPFEIPLNSDVRIRTHEEAPQESTARILKALRLLGYLSDPQHTAGYTREEKKLAEQRLADLGYL